MTKPFCINLTIVFTALWTISCSSPSQSESSHNISDKISYDSFLKELVHKKNAVSSGNFDSAKILLFQTLNSSIPSYWIGTPWDFNGTTQVPQKGDIACGYFLTTTMQQTGYNIKRVWMAQQASSVLINEYCADIKVESSVEGVKKYLSDQSDSSCYIIGLDFHTGYVVKEGANNFIIHSNYIANEGVIKENIDDASVLKHNKYFMIGSLSKRTDKLKDWMDWE